MKIAVFGSTGALGAQVLPRLLERGHTVRAIVSSPRRHPALVHERLSLQQGSILDAQACLAAAQGMDALLHLATAIPAPGPAMDWSRNDAIRREGTAHLLAAGEKEGVRRYVLQSVAMLTSDAAGRLLDETSPVVASPVIESAHRLEQLSLAAAAATGASVAVLRGGAFYGDEPGRMASWNRLAREGQLRFHAEGAAYLSLIHVADMARAVVRAVEQEASGLFNIVDDHPVTERELFAHVARLVGGPAPETGGRQIFGSFNVSNRKAKETLGWEPAYPSYLSGWRV